MVTISDLPASWSGMGASRKALAASRNALEGNHPGREWWLLEPASFVAGYASFVVGYASFVVGYASFVVGYAAGVSSFNKAPETKPTLRTAGWVTLGRGCRGSDPRFGPAVFKMGLV